MEEIIIRKASEADAERLLEIYSYYVENTAVTFEYDVPTLDEFRERIKKTLEFYPYLCAEKNGKIIGYAYAGRFHPRAAYQWCAETTVYLDKTAVGLGAGRMLYEELERRLREMGVLNMYACIAIPETPDEHLTDNSARFHEHMGFETVGRFRKCGYKFGRWYDMVWAEKMIGEHGSAPQKPHIRRK